MTKREKPAFQKVSDPKEAGQAQERAGVTVSVPTAGQGVPAPLSVAPSTAPAAAPATPPAADTLAPVTQPGDLAYLAGLAKSMAAKSNEKPATQRLTLDIDAELYKRIKTVAFLNNSTMLDDIEKLLRPAYFPEEATGQGS